MKKVILSMMMAGALLASGTAFAQTPTDGTTGATTQQSDCCQTNNTPQGKKKDGHKGGKKDGKTRAGKPKFNPFDGIELTADQQQRLQALRQGVGPVELTPEQQAKIPENPNLTAEQKKQLSAERKAAKLEARKNYLNGVKEVLTPEQYVIFLENVYLYRPIDKAQAFGKKAGKKGHHGEKGRKNGKHKADKPQEQKQQ